MNIRQYKTDDYKRLREILETSGLFDEVWDSENHLTEKISKDDQSILIAEENDEIIGCLLIMRDPWACFLYRLAVKESYRNRGVGSALLEAAENQLRDRGVEEVGLYVDSNKEELQDYYARRGYAKGGTYRCMYKKLQNDN